MVAAYFYRGGRRVPVRVLDTVHAVRVNGDRSPVEVRGWVSRPLDAKHALLIDPALVAVDERAAAPRLTSVLRTACRAVRTERTVAARRVSPALERPDLAIFPVACHPEGDSALVTTGELVVQMPDVEHVARRLGWTITRTLPFLPGGCVMTAPSSTDPFAAANELVERYGATIAHPVFIETIPDRDAVGGRLPALLAKQWHLESTGSNGARAGVDIAARRAWAITTGSPSIVACVIDSGMNVRHEVFSAANKCLPGFDFADMDSDPSPVASFHGTACAALVVAGPNTGDTLGVAPACRLLPVRRPEVTSHLDLAQALVWAADHGADVISCSFGLDGQPWVLPDVVRAAFEYVTTHGRRGKGCPIFWAAGNGSELVTTDEWASSPLTIAVAASTDQATRAPYSDYGPEISIAAPSSGGANGIVTAVNQGYTSQFGGTSAAAPVAAGVACLVLSVAPELTAREIEQLLQTTARKIDPASGAYDARGHSPYYGFGQVDAEAALRGIPVLLVVERLTATESLHPKLVAFLDDIARGAGRAIIDYLAARRLGLLQRLVEAAPLREATTRVLRLIALLADHLQDERLPTIPEAIWTDIQIIVNEVRRLPAA